MSGIAEAFVFIAKVVVQLVLLAVDLTCVGFFFAGAALPWRTLPLLGALFRVKDRGEFRILGLFSLGTAIADLVTLPAFALCVAGVWLWPWSMPNFFKALSKGGVDELPYNSEARAALWMAALFMVLDLLVLPFAAIAFCGLLYAGSAARELGRSFSSRPDEPSLEMRGQFIALAFYTVRDILLLPVFLVVLFSWRCLSLFKQLQGASDSGRSIPVVIFTEFFYYLVDIPIILCGLLCLCSWRCASLVSAVCSDDDHDWRQHSLLHFVELMADIPHVLAALVTLPFLWRSPIMLYGCFSSCSTSASDRRRVVRDQFIELLADIPHILAAIFVLATLWRAFPLARGCWAAPSGEQRREVARTQFVELLLDIPFFFTAALISASLFRMPSLWLGVLSLRFRARSTEEALLQPSSFRLELRSRGRLVLTVLATKAREFALRDLAGPLSVTLLGDEFFARLADKAGATFANYCRASATRDAALAADAIREDGDKCVLRFILPFAVSRARALSLLAQVCRADGVNPSIVLHIEDAVPPRGQPARVLLTLAAPASHYLQSAVKGVWAAAEGTASASRKVEEHNTRFFRGVVSEVTGEWLLDLGHLLLYFLSAIAPWRFLVTTVLLLEPLGVWAVHARTKFLQLTKMTSAIRRSLLSETALGCEREAKFAGGQRFVPEFAEYGASMVSRPERAGRVYAGKLPPDFDPTHPSAEEDATAQMREQQGAWALTLIRRVMLEGATHFAACEPESASEALALFRALGAQPELPPSLTLPPLPAEEDERRGAAEPLIGLAREQVALVVVEAGTSAAPAAGAFHVAIPVAAAAAAAPAESPYVGVEVQVPAELRPDAAGRRDGEGKDEKEEEKKLEERRREAAESPAKLRLLSSEEEAALPRDVAEALRPLVGVAPDADTTEALLKRWFDNDSAAVHVFVQQQQVLYQRATDSLDEEVAEALLTKTRGRARQLALDQRECEGRVERKIAEYHKAVSGFCRIAPSSLALRRSAEQREIIMSMFRAALFDVLCIPLFVIVLLSVYRTRWMLRALREADNIDWRKLVVLEHFLELCRDVLCLVLAFFIVATLYKAFPFVGALLDARSIREARAVVYQYFGRVLSDVGEFVTFLFSCRTLYYGGATVLWGSLMPAALIYRVLGGMQCCSLFLWLFFLVFPLALILGLVPDVGVPVSELQIDSPWSIDSLPGLPDAYAFAPDALRNVNAALGCYIVLVLAFVFIGVVKLGNERAERLKQVRPSAFVAVTWSNIVALFFVLWDTLQLCALAWSVFSFDLTAQQLRDENSVANSGGAMGFLESVAARVLFFQEKSFLPVTGAAIALAMLWYLVISAPLVMEELLGHHGTKEQFLRNRGWGFLVFSLSTTFNLFIAFTLLKTFKCSYFIVGRRDDQVFRLGVLQADPSRACWDSEHLKVSVLSLLFVTYYLFTTNLLNEEEGSQAVVAEDLDVRYPTLYVSATNLVKILMSIAIVLFSSEPNAFLAVLLVVAIALLLLTVFSRAVFGEPCCAVSWVVVLRAGGYVLVIWAVICAFVEQSQRNGTREVNAGVMYLVGGGVISVLVLGAILLERLRVNRSLAQRLHLSLLPDLRISLRELAALQERRGALLRDKWSKVSKAWLASVAHTSQPRLLAARLMDLERLLSTAALRREFVRLRFVWQYCLLNGGYTNVLERLAAEFAALPDAKAHAQGAAAADGGANSPRRGALGWLRQVQKLADAPEWLKLGVPEARGEPVSARDVQLALQILQVALSSDRVMLLGDAPCAAQEVRVGLYEAANALDTVWHNAARDDICPSGPHWKHLVYSAAPMSRTVFDLIDGKQRLENEPPREVAREGALSDVHVTYWSEGPDGQLRQLRVTLPLSAVAALRRFSVPGPMAEWRSRDELVFPARDVTHVYGLQPDSQNKAHAAAGARQQPPKTAAAVRAEARQPALELEEMGAAAAPRPPVATRESSNPFGDKPSELDVAAEWNAPQAAAPAAPAVDAAALPPPPPESKEQ